MRGSVNPQLRSLLRERNAILAGKLRAVTRLLELSHIPASLEPYREVLCKVCSQCNAHIQQNATDLILDEDSILDDILSNTRLVAGWVRKISESLATPILRASSTDKLCLDTILWIHQTHHLTEQLPAVFSDSPPAVLPFLQMVPIYYFPCVEQRGFLYQPLLFHEFGHVLYAVYRQEMDDLVRDMQEQIIEMLTPMSRRNDRHSAEQSIQRDRVVSAWYSWIHELFCDAVGLVMGGPAFLYAFSLYLSALEREDFWLPVSKLAGCSHPVNWIRVSLLTGRAADMGLAEAASRVSGDWSILAASLGVAEDYHGFYDSAFEPVVIQTISNMLTVADPRMCTAEDTEPSMPARSPVQLMNMAWTKYLSDPLAYEEWEAKVIDALLQDQEAAEH